MKTVGIIGAGPVGLLGVKYAIDSGFIPVCWEKSTVIGGTWVYSEKTGVDEHGYFRSGNIYDSLRVNTPREILSFYKYPMTEGNHSFVHHTDVIKYLNRFAKDFKLSQYIKLSHYVTTVEPIMKIDGPPRWRVSAHDLVNNEESQTEVDFIIVANGHFTAPQIPYIENINNFNGQTLHMRDYRKAAKFQDKSVVILGVGPSGRDLAMEISMVTKKLYLCYRGERMDLNFPDKIVECYDIEKATENGFLLSDGSYIEADALIYCTGYRLDFPFLKENCGISVKNETVSPLYQHAIHAEFPTMAFAGLQNYVTTFYFFDVQIRYIMEVFKGNVQIPSKEDFKKYMENEHQERKEANLPLEKFHFCVPAQRSQNYIETLEKEAKLESLPKVFHKLHEYSFNILSTKFYELRTIQYDIVDDFTFVAKRPNITTEIISIMEK